MGISGSGSQKILPAAMPIVQVDLTMSLRLRSGLYALSVPVIAFYLYLLNIPTYYPTLPRVKIDAWRYIYGFVTIMLIECRRPQPAIGLIKSGI